MLRRIGIAGTIATFATLLINLAPDTETKIGLALIFGLVFGVAWLKKSIQGIAGGLVFGVCAASAVAVINSLTAPLYPEQALILGIFKWIVPIAIYTTDLGIPLLDEA